MGKQELDNLVKIRKFGAVIPPRRGGWRTAAAVSRVGHRPPA